MQFDFKEKAKKRQDRNSPIKPLFCIQFENPSKVSWGEFQISMGFVQPPRSAPIFDSPHESLVTLYVMLRTVESPAVLISYNDKKEVQGNEF